MADPRTEFTVAGLRPFDRRGPWRWVWSHLARFPWQVAGLTLGVLVTAVRNVGVALLTGLAFDEVVRGDADAARLGLIALAIAAFVLLTNAVDVLGGLANEVLGKGLERDAREELFVALLGKSQTFHNRQRVGDVMARATNDLRLLNAMVVPGFGILADSAATTVAVVLAAASIDPRLTLAPGLFVVAGLVALRAYAKELGPVAADLRAQFGVVNAGLAEAIGGIEVVKSAAQEDQEEGKFRAGAGRYRDLYVRNGRIQARYLPLLLLAAAAAGAFLHGVLLYDRGTITLGQLAAYVGLMGALRVPAGLSIWTVNLAQLGLAAARRVLALMAEETELDEEAAGHRAPLRGELAFEGVTFSYGGDPVLRDVSFRVEPGQTVAIVGQTGAGKSTLASLVNRTYDVSAGRVLVDGVDVRDWSMDSLRSQIATIEQDVFLFSRSIAANIAFAATEATQDEIERAAREAQADAFVRAFRDGYETVVGERGVTLSGGQRQRVAIARALLTDPRVLILDDATSAVDSATEDEIQLAIRRVEQGRTTLLITHRLSQIRRADKVLLLHRGALAAEGTHDDLLRTSDLYRRIFARYEGAPEPEPIPAGAASS